MIKKYYKISEVSGMYNIGCDSLRYYEELGLLNPERDENGYRLYSVADMSRCNIIRDLRKLNMPTSRIKKYLANRTVATTLELFRNEKKQLEKKLRELETTKANIEKRITDLEACLSLETDKIQVKRFPARKCASLNESVSLDGEVDLLFQQVRQNQDGKLYILGNTGAGARVSAQSVREGLYDRYNAIFFLLDDSAEEYDFMLPEGDYLCAAFLGDYDKGRILTAKMYRYAREHKLAVVEQPLELYCVDIHETADRQEFLTQIQLRIQ